MSLHPKAFFEQIPTILRKLPKLGILAQADRLLMKGTADLVYSPIFIVGNPRSGSTLLYQSITLYFKTCYFSNLMNLFSRSPICVAMLVSHINGCCPQDGFHNKFGKTVGWTSPNQGEHIWKRWFMDLYKSEVVNARLGPNEAEELFKSIALLQKAFRLPSVHKWQPLSERVLDLANIFPKALFIRIKRAPEFIAQSILQSKRLLWDDETRWFSTKPREYERISRCSPLDQVCEQVICIDNDINSDFDVIGDDRCLVVGYEDLCECPGRVMNQVKDFYSRKGGSELQERGRDLPSHFSSGNRAKISDAEFSYIDRYFKKRGF